MKVLTITLMDSVIVQSAEDCWKAMDDYAKLNRGVAVVLR